VTAVALFDLDGTLTDSRLGIVRSIRYALDRLSHPCPSDDVLATFIGPSLRLGFGTLLATKDRQRIDHALALYRERYAEVGLYECEVYGGVPEMLAEVAAAGARLYVVTAKALVYAERVVDHFGLGRHFAGIYGPTLEGRFDDKAELIAHVADTEGHSARAAVMIGDRAPDMIAAKKNGARAVGALWGFGSERELTDAGADAVCPRPRALPACLAALR
jgi:phosphoglycolate phosphatase